MNTLVIPLSRITDKGLSIRVDMTVADLAGPDVSEAPVGTVTVVGALTEVGGEFLFRGGISGAFVQPCDRCLEDASLPFSVDVCWTYEEAPPSGGAAETAESTAEASDDNVVAAHQFQGGAIDLRPQAWEEVALAIPAKCLCREDCAGLCPTCGANLNHAPCRCGGELKLENKGLAGLGDLFPELRPKDLEG